MDQTNLKIWTSEEIEEGSVGDVPAGDHWPKHLLVWMGSQDGLIDPVPIVWYYILSCKSISVAPYTH